MRRLAAVVLLVACTATAAACGASESSSDEFQGDQRAVAEAVEDVQDATRSQDADDLCNDLLTTSLARAIAQRGSTCADELGASIDDSDDTELDVVAVTVSGTTARATVRGAGANDDRRSVLSFVRERGRWRLSAVASGQQR